jgi:cysteinyl-tRNA synthetase
MNLSLYDTYQKSNTSISLSKTIKLYSCGPTVYSYQHIGNVIAVLFPQLIANTIRYCGGQVIWVSNVTDLGHLTDDGDNGEDKMEKGARLENKTPQEIATFYYQDFLKQLEMVNIEFPSGFYNPYATDYIYEQMYIALELLKQGRAYLLNDGIYFSYDNNQDIDYSFLPKSNGSHDYTGRDIINTTKNPEDFALWKFVDEDTLQKYRFSDYPQLQDHYKLDQDILIKYGCPGWHTECVAMIAAVLGVGVGYKPKDFSFKNLQGVKGLIDIHTGGEDHINIHHKNEILQSLALGFQLSKAWVHNKHLKVNNTKMSKSLGNVFNIIGDKSVTGYDSVVGLGYNPLAFRLLFLEHNYQEQINFTWDKLTQSQNRLHAMYKLAAAINDTSTNTTTNTNLDQIFQDLLLDNLQTSSVLELFQKHLTEQVTARNNNQLDITILNSLRLLDSKVLMLNIFQNNIPDHDHQLANTRYQSKLIKDYQAADISRNTLQELGYEVDDYKWGTAIWRR